MRSDTEAVLLDMDRHVRFANQFAEGLDFAAFQQDERTIFAVIRSLEIISEASRRLPEDLKGRHPSIPWKEMAGAGNVCRRDYEDASPRLLWDNVQLALPPLHSLRLDQLIRLHHRSLERVA